MEIYTNIFGDTGKITAIFDVNDQFNVCQKVYDIKECIKLNNDRYPMAKKTVHAQKIYILCGSSYNIFFANI